VCGLSRIAHPKRLLGLYGEYLVLQTTTNRVVDFDVHFSVVTFSEL